MRAPNKSNKKAIKNQYKYNGNIYLNSINKSISAIHVLTLVL